MKAYDMYIRDNNDYFFIFKLKFFQALLLNIPGWDWRRDDQAVCLNEVKYGLLAQVIQVNKFGPFFTSEPLVLILGNKYQQKIQNKFENKQ